MPYKLPQDDEGVCLQCGTVIRGRSDKHFCSLSCKNGWHNREMQARRQIRTRTMAALSSNYSILEALLSDGKTGAGLEELCGMGFDPNYVTAHRRGHFHHDEYACFDIWYNRTDTRIFNVRRKAAVPR